MRALLIIDMQNESFQPDAPFNASGVIERINALSDKFRQNGDNVIFIQHDGTKEGCYIASTEAWEIVPSLEVKPDDLIISKMANDSFYKTKLKEELEKRVVDELVVTGYATDFCVDATVKSALVNDINVTVISDGHTTHNKPNLKAQQLIDHYNWVWREMAQTKSKIQVIDFDSYMNLSEDKRLFRI
jgi:nicotinamidase-related amidase